MRTLAIASLIVLGASPAYAMSCWYNENGTYTGRDGTPSWAADIPAGQSGQLRESGDYAWVYNTLQGEDCPQSIDTGAGAGGQSGGQSGGEAAAPDWSLDPVFGSADLMAGFQPDPHTVEVQAGGTIDSSTVIANCAAGLIAEAPDYRVNYQAGDYPLIFKIESNSDTTLAINGPDGTWSCNDDTAELNPQVQFDNPASGQYDIWVGEWAGEYPGATLSVTELATSPGQTTTGAVPLGDPPGSYLQSCRNLSIDGDRMLTADCRDFGGSYQTTSIDRPYDCAGGLDNINGELRCAIRELGNPDLPPGSYIYTCRDVSIAGDVLTADCEDSRGRYIGFTQLSGPFYSGVDVANCNGYLRMGGC